MGRQLVLMSSAVLSIYISHLEHASVPGVTPHFKMPRLERTPQVAEEQGFHRRLKGCEKWTKHNRKCKLGITGRVIVATHFGRRACCTESVGLLCPLTGYTIVYSYGDRAYRGTRGNVRWKYRTPWLPIWIKHSHCQPDAAPELLGGRPALERN